MKSVSVKGITALISFCWLVGQAHAAATLLPPGQQCFQATSPTSGGLSGPITTLGTITGGSGYISASYPNVPLTGGSGFGATATITVSGGSVSSVSVTNPGTHYAAGDTLSASSALLGGSGAGFSVPVSNVSTTGTGMLGLLGTITGGSGGAAGTYPGVAFTGGSGSGGTANITVSGGGAVTAVAVLNPGTGYAVGDTLSAASGNIGGVSGFSIPVSSVTINQALAGGSVGMFIPNTNTFKQTWANAQQTILNTNPITLDQNGCATIYGTGSYRQVLQDALGNVVWDKITTDTSAQQNVFWAGNAGGTPNAITLVDPGFNGTDGSIINFTPIATNTGATTINPSSFSNITVVKDTTGGPAALTGGEIIGTSPANVVSVVYDAAQNNFHLLNTAIASASGANSPLCGANNLKITNGGTPNSVISLTADQVVMQNAAGLVINRGSVSLTNINITTGTSISTANGMDGESPGTSNWLYIWAIDNGAGPAGLVSLSSGNGLAPILPSGYSYKCRMGAMRVDGSGNLLRTLQAGQEAQYEVQASGALPIVTTSFGTYWTSQSLATFAPATATQATLAAEFLFNSTPLTNATATASAAVAPNSNYTTSGPGTSGRPPCSSLMNVAISGSGTRQDQPAVAMTCLLLLESANIFTGAATTGGATNSSTLSMLGWKDAVNAN